MNNTTYDVAVVGAGAAGLQAALTLGRMNRPVAVFGTDRYRNDPAAEMHNFLGHDGTPPAELRAAARADLERYPAVELKEQAVTAIEGAPGAFTLHTLDGSEVAARRVLLATGAADTLPDIPGLDALWGDVVAHCPYCHGYEFSGTPVGILGSEASVPLRAAMLERIASRLVVLTNGAELEQAVAGALKRMDVDVRTDPVVGVCRGPLGISVELAGGPVLELGGLFVGPGWAQAAPFAEQLDLDRSPMGAVLVDAFGRTSRPGVYAAGDIAQAPGLPMPMSSVLVAAASGQVAAAACDRELAAADNGLALPV
ncbi:NAD(P)/FAD-dependent oxidoreductase [Nocardioides bizhenqiangii]|uniref:NAD(P)/FAD-dependent oxidoreductase n=1 Tax=Nocardioides bizhenqiangii TaxID=3095076 RepID=A0ABZ0ZQ42_9ACTN|nr:NAD(P)/FAD-dependent oxidoreductase [Nocardioides sp. HM61]WQQ26486.1 NAD(P)/FAD-dependent oxidoreductase [Nocardioides sp. HM61]